jgi:mono/diheme cytochrome c family protein
MKFRFSAAELLLFAVVVGGVGLAVWHLLSGGGSSEAASPAVKLPEFSAAALSGKAAFGANCARCHGENGLGTKQGPPLLNDIYNSGHHPDASFQSAVRHGVRQHHWPFGDMPAQPQVTDEQLAQIIRYVRELQAVNGIVHREHRM